MGAADERLRRLLDRQTPSIRRTILDALRGMSQGSIEALTDALERADVQAAVNIAVGELDALTGPLAEQLRTALTAAARVTSAEFGLRFDMADPNAIRVAQSLAANAVVGVELETKQAIREIIVAGIRDGIPPRDSARQIRRIVGLTQRDAGAVDNLWRRMLADGVKQEQADARAARYAERLLRRRAENIARTETINASTQGRRLGWQQAADAGYLDPSTARIVWIVTQDDRLCPQCAPLAGMTVGFYDAFTATERATGDLGQNRGGITPYTGGTEPLKAHITVNGPPLHPSCRCDLGLQFESTTASPGNVSQPATTRPDGRPTTATLPGRSILPDWDPKTQTFRGVKEVETVYDTRRVPAEIRSEVETVMRRAVDGFDPRFRPPRVEVVSDDLLSLGGGGEYLVRGIKVGKDRIVVAETYFTNEFTPWRPRLEAMMRHETAHRMEAVLIDELERGGLQYGEALRVRDRFRAEARALMRSWTDAEAERWGLEYPWFASTRPDTFDGGAELFAEAMSRRNGGLPNHPDVNALLDRWVK